MIATIAAYKEAIMASSGDKLRSAPAVSTAGQASSISHAPPSDAVSVDLSVSHDVFSAVDNYFNMGSSGRFDAFHSLNRADKEQFIKIVAELARSGYMGYEELVVNKKVERHEISTQIGDHRLENARLYDRPKPPAS